MKKYILLTVLTVFFQIVELTAYTPYECGGRTTASGTDAREGITCAADYVGGIYLPFGTTIEFPDGQTFTVEDRFGAGHNNRVDIFVENYDRAIQFGRHVIEVKVTTPD